MHQPNAIDDAMNNVTMVKVDGENQRVILYISYILSIYIYILYWGYGWLCHVVSRCPQPVLAYTHMTDTYAVSSAWVIQNNLIKNKISRSLGNIILIGKPK